MTAFRKAGTLALVITGFLFAGLSGNLIAQNVYKMTDEDGNVEYTDRPWEFGDNYKAEMVTGIEIDWTNQDQVQAMINEQNARYEQDEVNSQVNAEIQAEEAAEQAAEDQQRAENCEKAREIQRKYEENSRLYTTNSEGERDYLSSGELDKRRKKAADAVTVWCN